MRRVFLILLLCEFSVLAFAQSERSNELFAKGMQLYETEQYAAAIGVFEEMYALDRIEMDTTSVRFGYVYSWISSCYYKMGQFEKAKETESKDFEFQPIDRRLTIQVDSLCDAGIKASLDKDFHRAAALFIKVIELEAEVIPYICPRRVIDILFCAFCMSECKEVENAIQMCSLAHLLCENGIQPSNPTYIEPMKCKGIILHEAGRLEEAGETLGEVAEFLRNNHQEDSEDYLSIMQRALVLATDLGDAEALNEGYPVVLDLIAKHYGEESEQYLNQMATVVNMLTVMSDSACVVVGEELSRRVKTKYGRESMPYYRTCVQLFKAAGKVMRTDLMRHYLNEAANLASVMEPEHPENQHLFNLVLSMIYVKEDADSAMVMAEKGLEGLQQMGIADGSYYHMGRYVKGIVLGVKGHYREASELLMTSIDHIPNQDSLSIWQNKLMLSYYLCMSGNYTTGRNIGLHAIDELRTFLGRPRTGAQSRSVVPILKMMINIYDNARSDALFNMPDSVKYNYGLLHRELLLLHVEQMIKLDSFEKSELFMALEQYGRTSYFTRDYLYTRRVVSNYATIVKEMYGEMSWEYDRVLDALAHCYEEHDPELVALLKRQINIEKKVYGRRHEVVLDKMVQYYEAKGDNESLMALQQRRQKHGGGNSLQLAKLYDAKNDPMSAMLHYKENFEYLVKNKDDDSNIFLSADGVLSSLSRLKDTERLANELADMMKLLAERRPHILRQHLFWLATLCFRTEDVESYRRCVADLSEVLPIIAEDAQVQACLAVCPYIRGYFSKEQREAVLECYDQAIEIARQLNNQRLTDELMLCRHKSDFYGRHFWIDYLERDEAIEMQHIGQQIERLLQNYPDYGQYIDYQYALAMQLQAAMKLRDNKEVERLCAAFVPIMEIKKRDFIAEGEMARIMLNTQLTSRELFDTGSLCTIALRASSFLDRGKIHDQLGTIALRMRLGQLRENLASPYYRSSAQKGMEQFIEDAVRLASLSHSDSLVASAYDASIFSKGAMLRSEKLLVRHIRQVGNVTAQNKLDELRQVMMSIDQARQQGRDIESLNKRRISIEQDLLQVSSMFGDYTRSMVASWTDIRKQLSEGDVAIEFAQYPEGDNIRYCALLLTFDSRVPQLISLCTAVDLMAARDSADYSNVYQLVWKPLEQRTTQKQHIYFSPSGLLHQIAVEDALLPDGTRMSEHYRLFRLSNTRELLGKRTHKKNTEKAFLMGGISYYLDKTEWEHLAKKESLVIDDDRPNLRSLPLLRDISRGAMEELSGTEQEIDDIVSQLSRHHISHLSLKGGDASEGAFKCLDGADYSILHVATHGFYHQQKIDSHADTFNDEEYINMERSGLLLAGAFSTLHGEQRPDDVDDGILTAAEISRLDLTKAEMVVLSACETALGDITGEGVFGLQRGFKKAGANSILMSLWKVDDEATCLLMTEFYRNWIGEKMTKHDALEEAKKTVRSHKEKGWDDPKYWAAFILLDALD